jgi:hypothetical protein
MCGVEAFSFVMHDQKFASADTVFFDFVVETS